MGINFQLMKTENEVSYTMCDFLQNTWSCKVCSLCVLF
jgi:hypothetical protein